MQNYNKTLKIIKIDILSHVCLELAIISHRYEKKNKLHQTAMAFL